MVSRAPIDVFRYADYRAFLLAFYAQKKEQRRGISLRAFSRKVGLRSPNYLKLVMDGDRNLTPELALRFAEACGLHGEGVDYFCALVAFNQSKGQKARELHFARLKGFRRYRDTHKLDVAQDAYHSQWYIPAIRELVARSDFSADPKWIAKTLLPKITEAEARKALAVLFELGLLIDGPDGRTQQAEPLVETGAGPLGHHIVSFHREMMRLASEALERVPREDREIASLTLCVSQKQLRELKAELERIEAQLLQRYPADDAERVVQINVQMFPLSNGKE